MRGVEVLNIFELEDDDIIFLAREGPGRAKQINLDETMASR
jgi:hypothetical protein